jgi:hypothetical protein
MREKQFEQKVKQFLKEQQCWVLKTWSNGVQREGVPDLLACVDGYFVAIELKAEKGKPSELQLWNIEQIRKAEGIAIVLYPDQFEQFQHMIKLLRSGNIYAPKIQYKFDRKEKQDESL